MDEADLMCDLHDTRSPVNMPRIPCTDPAEERERKRERDRRREETRGYAVTSSLTISPCMCLFTSAAFRFPAPNVWVLFLKRTCVSCRDQHETIFVQ
jgi:hypothetical protein